MLIHDENASIHMIECENDDMINIRYETHLNCSKNIGIRQIGVWYRFDWNLC